MKLLLNGFGKCIGKYGKVVNYHNDWMEAVIAHCIKENSLMCVG